ncbi:MULTISPECIES: hypothetical protein [Rhodopseudomonas]|uniref:Uncharacterized protein n=1 Tax=Rhodopseudomonas palustris TaxID=1076 RepID=A0A0D7EZT2_RHOPL|nr:MULTISPECIES: hypothetical protein [Rhodopseudomonas]KIZ44957.1 hypothetical protein OO17_08795 [Rhodopseudomonas palustris]MDF3813173.1 hypothetical protein [Rhodopseudomonas sp. BAL398]WOK17866.1 hypothetical protein RBJ75_27780 [Rhodopseudomonas sp. BAL398]
MPHSYEQKITALLEQETPMRLWLEQKRALTRDSAGGTVIIGLSAEETEEFLRLSRLVQSRDAGITAADARAISDRHAALKARLEEALQEDAIESLSSWGDAPRP